MTFSLGALTTSVMAHNVLNSTTLAYDARTGRITFGVTQGQFAYSPVKIALYDVSGRQVLQIINRNCKENTKYAIDLKKELRALTKTSAAGKYICQLSVSGTVLSSLPIMIQ